MFLNFSNIFKFNLYFLWYLSNDMNLFNHRYHHWYLNWYYWYLNWYHRYLHRGFYDHCGLCFNNFGLYNFFFHNYNFSFSLSFSLSYCSCFSLNCCLCFSLCCC